MQTTIEPYHPDQRYDSDLSPGRWRWEVKAGSTYSGVAPTQAEAWRQVCETIGHISPLLPFNGVSDLRARLTAAEAALAAAQAELTQARADLRVMAGLAWGGCDERFALSTFTIGDDVTAAVGGAEDAVYGMTDDDVMAAVRRALGVA